MIGKFALYLSLVAGILAVFGYVQAALGKREKIKIGRAGFLFSALGIFTASILLMTKILLHDFSIAYVWSYSSRDLPLHLLLSTFYAGQEGSFLFWALCSAVISLFLFSYTRKRNIEEHILAIFLAVQTFLVLLLIAKSPFKTIYEQFPGELTAGQVPFDGRGLNPLLQNVWMIAHPPVLFIGFAVMAVPFSFAVAALWRRDYSHWISAAFPWVLFSGLALSAGLMIGAYWAYGVLGWGGYWGWDPVENSSLIPWLIAAALIHSMLVQLRTGKLVRTNFIFAILSFVLVIYSTFLTRSGVLGDSSVHSFTDPGAIVYGMLVLFLFGAIALGFGFLFVRRSELKALAGPMQWLTREFALTLGSLVLLASAIIVFFGTSLPMFSTTQVEPSFYNRMNFPVAIFMMLLIGYSFYVRWEEEDTTLLKVKIWKPLSTAFAGSLAIAFFSSFNPMFILYNFAAIFVLYANIEIIYLTSRGDIRTMGGKITHIGVAVFLIGVIISGNYDQEKPAVLELNKPQSMFGYTVTYTGKEILEGNKHQFTVNVTKEGTTKILHPVMFETENQGTMRNPDIESFFSKDVYISPVSFEDQRMSNNGTFLLHKEETIQIGEASIKFSAFEMNSNHTEMSAEGMKVGVVLEISLKGKKETIIPYVVFGENVPKYFGVKSKLLDDTVELQAINIGGMGDGRSVIQISLPKSRGEQKVEKEETLTIEASIKPFISLVWIGTLLILTGFTISIFRRKKLDKK
ncbi:MAG: cytochrome c biogenesis protein CcsA [Bacteroidetes bacterium]|nr:cytochrome c biogenesis protein CcsA [Bacteroidota bacterium]